MFDAVTMAVAGASIGAIVLAASLVAIGAIGAARGGLWASYITLCALAHAVLARKRRSANTAAGTWRAWALPFAAICFAEGAGWGWASVALAAGDGFEIRLLVIVVTLGVAAGSVPVFGPFLPAFLVFFLPTVLPYSILGYGHAISTEETGAVLLMAIFTIAMGSLGARSNAIFARMLELRFSNEDMAEDLRLQRDIAKQADRTKSAFLAAASHDLRQPVHALGLFAAALGGVEMPPEGTRLVTQIQASTTALDVLFSALLDISRLDAGVVDVDRRIFALDPLLARICDEHRGEAAAKGIALRHARSSLVVNSDPVLVERILRNLVSNAVRYTDRGRILAGVRRREHTVVAQIWDTGRGIPAEHHNDVFQEYFQLGNLERDREKGLGLGLAIVRRLSLLLECPVTLRSTPGKGSCFQISLNLAHSDPEAKFTFNPVAAPTEGRGLIAVVDDEAPIREAMTKLLSGWGYTVIAAASGGDMIRELAACREAPMLIVADYRLKERESGIEVIERIRAEYNDDDVPAVLITGDTAPERLAEARRSGLPLLHKPVSNGRLRAAIVNLTSEANRARREADAAR